MKDRKKMLLSLLTVFAALFFFTLTVGAYQYHEYAFAPNDTMRLFCSGGSAYLLSSSGNELHLENVSAGTGGVTLTLDYPVMSFDPDGEMIAVACSNHTAGETIVYLYHMNTGVLESCVISGVELTDSQAIVLTGSELYWRNPRNTREAVCYSTVGKHKDTYLFEAEISGVAKDRNGKVYAVANGILYEKNDSTFYALSGDGVSARISFIGERIFTDERGDIFSLNGSGSYSRIGVTPSGNMDAVVCVGGQLCFADENEVVMREIGGSADVAYRELNAPVRMLGYDGTCLVALSDSVPIRAVTFTPDEMISISVGYENSETQSGQDHPDPVFFDEAMSAGGLNDETAPFGIYSDMYRWDYELLKIYDIPEGTTVAQFKKNVSHDGYDMRVFRSGKEVRSGRLGTGMMIQFAGYDSYTFEISVIGDITGEGNVNRRDVRLVMRYKLQTATFDGVYLAAGDINQNGKIDLDDISLMMKMWKKNYDSHLAGLD